MSWQGAPKSGEVWRKPGGTMPQETRTVIDCTIGGDVLYFVGDWRRRCERQCTKFMWNQWVCHARKVE